jgi:hypothetical protein
VARPGLAGGRGDLEVVLPHVGDAGDAPVLGHLPGQRLAERDARGRARLGEGEAGLALQDRSGVVEGVEDAHLRPQVPRQVGEDAVGHHVLADLAARLLRQLRLAAVDPLLAAHGLVCDCCAARASS